MADSKLSAIATALAGASVDTAADRLYIYDSSAGTAGSKYIVPAELLIAFGLGAIYQPLDADLTAIAAQVSAADKVLYATGPATWALADFTAAGRSIVGAANAAAQRTALGLGTAAQSATGDFDAAGAASAAYSAAVAASDPAGTAASAVSTHAALQTGVHGISITSGKTLSATNTLTLAGTDGSTLNVGAGGTLAAVSYSGSATDLGSGTLAAARMPALTGDITTSAGAVATTLATVNGNVGSFGSATQSVAITVNAKGLVTAASAATITPAVGSITGLGTGVATALAATPNASGGVLTYGNAAVLTANTFTATQTITPAANTSALVVTGHSLTSSNTSGIINLATALSTSGDAVLFGIDASVTTWGASGKFLRFRNGASGTTEVFNVDKNGNILANKIVVADRFGSFTSGDFIVGGDYYRLASVGSNICLLASGYSATSVLKYGAFLASTGVVGWGSSSAPEYSTTVDVAISRSAAGVLQVTQGDSGTYRDLLARAYRCTAIAFASLPTGVQGMVAHVSDSTTATWGATIAGGGSNKVLAFYNGTNWTVAGI